MLINTGNVKRFVNRAGEGTPTVVFEAGLGEDHSTWQDVQPVIAQVTRTLSYDKAGLGQSDAAVGPRTVRQIASELHSMLQVLNLRGPFIMVGHSLGGYIIILFAHQYPAETAGLVFVDSAFDELRLKQSVTAEVWAERQRALEKYIPPMSPGQQMEKESADESSQQATGARPLPDVPAVILSGTLINPGFPASAVEQEVKLRTHREWAAALPQSERVIVPEARHYLQNETPPVVIDAVIRVILKARSLQ